jgi:hypothetical protein
MSSTTTCKKLVGMYARAVAGVAPDLEQTGTACAYGVWKILYTSVQN